MKDIKNLKMHLFIITILIINTLLSNVYAQQSADEMFKKEVVRAIDLREKQNEPIFSKNNEITKYLIEAVKKGNIIAYTNDSLTSSLNMDEFLNSITIPSTGTVVNFNNPADTISAYLDFGSDWRDFVLAREEYLPKDIYQMEMKEDIIFDKSMSTLKYNIKVITIFVPADHPLNVKGIQIPIASFDYSQVLENIFKNPEAIWFNNQNDATHLSLANAFNLRLFSSYITKVSNSKDQTLADIFNDDNSGRYASECKAAELLEYEHHLWEY